MPTPGGLLGAPISDDSDDDVSQIRQLDEEKKLPGLQYMGVSNLMMGEDVGLSQGIYPLPEVVVPPQSDSDEDIPIKEVQSPFAEQLQLEEEALQRATARAEHARGSVFEVATSSAQLKKSDSRGPDGQSSSAHADEVDDIPIGKPSIDYPSGPPPAYESADEEEKANQPPRFTPGMDKELMLGNISKPFQSMRHAMESDEEDSEEDEIGNRTRKTGRGDDEDANASPEERALFAFVTAFNPENVEIEPILKPFLLEFIPAVGDIDAFIKIPRPDEVEDNVGLTMLDEPAAKQSDPTILDMQMRSAAKEVGVQMETPVKQLDRADKNTSEIENWIKNIKLHRSKPPATVHYSRPMPDIEKLMQEWPPDVEKALRGATLPTADLDVPLEQFADIVLSLVDIPVHKSRIHSLHVLFTLFAEFKNSQHFRSLAAEPSAPKENTERMEL